MPGFNEMLRNYRKKQNLTQAELAKRVGVSGQVISNWERGYTTGISAEMINKLADALNTSSANLLGNSKEIFENCDYSQISLKLKHLRESFGFTQQELADKLSIPCPTLARYETGKKQPSYEVLSKISEIFDVPTDYLLGVGKFANWDLILENKDTIIDQIFRFNSMLTLDFLNNMDEIHLAKLVCAYDIHITRHTDGDSIAMRFPFSFPEEMSSSSTSTIEVLSVKEAKLISIFRSLPEDDKDILYGKALDLIRTYIESSNSYGPLPIDVFLKENKKNAEDRQHEDSVEAEEPDLKTGTDNLGK